MFFFFFQALPAPRWLSDRAFLSPDVLQWLIAVSQEQQEQEDEEDHQEHPES